MILMINGDSDDDTDDDDDLQTSLLLSDVRW